MKGAVEAVCFVNGGDKLCINKRDTSYMYLAYFDPKDENEHIFAEHTNYFLDFFSAMAISNLVLSHTIDTLLDSNWMHNIPQFQQLLLVFSTLMSHLQSCICLYPPIRKIYALQPILLCETLLSKSKPITLSEISCMDIRTMDSFSQPCIVWSSNEHYIFGNTQEDTSSLCV